MTHYGFFKLWWLFITFLMAFFALFFLHFLWDLISPLKCNIDQQCNDWNECTIDTCNNGKCLNVLVVNATCSISDDCAFPLDCIDCQCVDLCENITCTNLECENSVCFKGICSIPEMIPGCGGCQSDSDCPSDMDSCTTELCVNNTCLHKVLPPNECSNTTHCNGFNQICVDCLCIDSCANITCNENPCIFEKCIDGMCMSIGDPIPNCCVNDTDCFNNDMDNCTTSICIDNFCQEKVLSPNECSKTTSCTFFNQLCIDCLCIDSCENITCNENPCILEQCIDGECIQIGNGTLPNCCEDDEDCDDGVTCTIDTCTNGECSYSLVGDCVTNGDCSTNENCIDCQCEDLCLNVTCTSNVCETKQCSHGICLVVDVIQGCCFEDSQCPILNQCFRGVCTMDNTCIQDLATNATCSYDNECPVGNFCDISTCTCEPLPGVECFDDSECNDNVTCTLDYCQINYECIFKQLPGCCSDNSDCIDNNPCHTNFTCNNSTGLCSFEIFDEDSDNVPCTIDCNDEDDTIGVAERWYRDFDGDGDGCPSMSVISCTQPSGFVNNSLDCNDQNPLIFYQSQVCNLTLFNEALLVTPFQTQFNPIQFNFSASTFFGVDVASHENTVVIGANGFQMTNDTITGAVFVFIRDFELLPLQQILFPNISEDPTDFGISVDIYGNFIVVGDPTATSTGLVYIFERNSGVWTHVDTLSPSLSNMTSFGTDVSINQNLTIAITSASQRLFTFIKSSGSSTWIESANIVNPDLGICGGFECFFDRVGINSDGSLIVVGSGAITTTGRAYVFSHDGTSLTQLQKLESDNPSSLSNANFGISVAIDDDGKSIVIGSPLEEIEIDFTSTTITSTGIGFLFYNEFSTANWTIAQKLISNIASNSDICGTCVSIRNGTILIGCPATNTRSYLNIYKQSIVHQLPIGDMPNRFELAGRGKPFDITSGDTTIQYGTSCDTYGNKLIIGAPTQDFSGFSSVGGAYSMYCLPKTTCP